LLRYPTSPINGSHGISLEPTALFWWDWEVYLQVSTNNKKVASSPRPVSPPSLANTMSKTCCCCRHQSQKKHHRPPPREIRISIFSTRQVFGLDMLHSRRHGATGATQTGVCASKGMELTDRHYIRSQSPPGHGIRRVKQASSRVERKATWTD